MDPEVLTSNPFGSLKLVNDFKEGRPLQDFKKHQKLVATSSKNTDDASKSRLEKKTDLKLLS